MRKFTNNKELASPAITRFATSFISLQSLLNSMWDVKRMFLSEWRALTISRKPEGEAICRLVSYQENFWAGRQEVCTVIEPLVKVLRLVDGEKPAMGYLDNVVDRAKESIRAYYDDKGDEGFQKQLLLWDVIDERWNNTLHRPIHAAGIYLNPAFSYPCGFLLDAEIMDGFLTCVQRMMHGGLAMVQEYPISKSLPFESSTKHVAPQDASVTGVLQTQQLNNMVYIYYNLRLWVKQLERIPDMEDVSLDGIDTTVAWSIEVERPLMESIDDWLEQKVVEGVEGERRGRRSNKGRSNRRR
eukprot:PITA_15356